MRAGVTVSFVIFLATHPFVWQFQKPVCLSLLSLSPPCPSLAVPAVPHSPLTSGSSIPSALLFPKLSACFKARGKRAPLSVFVHSAEIQICFQVRLLTAFPFPVVSSTSGSTSASCAAQKGLPRWLRGKESAHQGRSCRFDLWVGKIPWRRKWQPTPVCWPGESRGQRSLAGYSSWGRLPSTCGLSP